jgi:replicative DNA helicase
MLSAESFVNSWSLRTGAVREEEDFNRIRDALEVLSKAPIYIDDKPGNNILAMRAVARRLKRERGIGLLIVDYLQLMSGSAKRVESRQQEVSQISRDLKGLAKEMNVPVVALSQLSRAPESRSDHRPQLADLRESGALEQDADVVAFIYREEQYKTPEERANLPGDQKNVAELIVAKQRNGPTGTVDLRFTPASMRFDNLYRE